ncbi:hypothetical protein AVHY2522_13330 [Acidovorax sp. SUPP2522]|uniref:hypothetical protein n=1 Tax=unclassified Acidovorax TaxID=2684926 RepID=UPI00234BBC68|nr:MULTISPECIES: hypothetical protein [unclassified Acidovorax]WCM96325.1 hypothetical protein M5C96_18055 [Acidovorax sp. GBBC 1281]GKT16895.1 hypothetical protein AVHY2522_13330 [Acidovorax sp. SUPP2522]
MKSLPLVSHLLSSLRARALQWLQQVSHGSGALRAPARVPVRIDPARPAQPARHRRYRD